MSAITWITPMIQMVSWKYLWVSQALRSHIQPQGLYLVALVADIGCKPALLPFQVSAKYEEWGWSPWHDLRISRLNSHDGFLQLTVPDWTLWILGRLGDCVSNMGHQWAHRRVVVCFRVQFWEISHNVSCLIRSHYSRLKSNVFFTNFPSHVF